MPAAARPDGADLVILNTCHIREKAAEKVFSELGTIRRLKAARERGRPHGHRRRGLRRAGRGRGILARAPFVDLVFGPQAYHRLPEMVARAPARRRPGPRHRASRPSRNSIICRSDRGERGGVSAFLTVQEGCDKFCTFCVVPYTRGTEFSRPAAARDRRGPAPGRDGAREITLLGPERQRLSRRGATDRRRWRLGELIRALADDPRPAPAALHDLASARCR